MKYFKNRREQHIDIVLEQKDRKNFYKTEMLQEKEQSRWRQIDYAYHQLEGRII